MKRNKNSNCVVYQANIKDGKIDENEPIIVFWLKIEPSYIKSNRDSGKNDDKQGLTFIERKMAYGVSCTKTDEKNKWKVQFVALGNREVYLIYDEEQKRYVVIGKPSDKE